MRLKTDSWKIIELIIMRYPEKKREYEDYVSDIMSSSGTGEGYLGTGEESTAPQSVTEAKALKMTSAYADKLKREIAAVEFVYNGLNREEQKVMETRYWSKVRKKVTYTDMTRRCCYSERQMKRIIFKIICQVGRYLGEIN